MSTDKQTAKDILNDKRELFLNSPVGYPFAEKIEKGEEMRLKSFLINVTPDDVMQQAIRDGSHEQIIGTFLENGFTFDPEWFGARLLDWQKERGM